MKQSPDNGPVTILPLGRLPDSPTLVWSVAELYVAPSVQKLLKFDFRGWRAKEETMHSLIYLVGLIVVVLLILSFLGLR